MSKALGLSASDELKVIFARLVGKLDQWDAKIDLGPEAACANIGSVFATLLNRKLDDVHETNQDLSRALRDVEYEYFTPDTGKDFGEELPIPYWDYGFKLGDATRTGDTASVKIRYGIHNLWTTFEKDKDGEWRAQECSAKESVKLPETRISDLKQLVQVLQELAPNPGRNAFMAEIQKRYSGPSPVVELLEATKAAITAQQDRLAAEVGELSGKLAKAVGAPVKKLSKSDLQALVQWAPVVEESPELARYRS